jgi:uncharacterized damage-inducible protein DinB
MRYPSQCIIPEYVVADVEWHPPFGAKRLQGVGTMKTLSLLLFLFLSAPALSAQAPEGIWQGYDGEWRHVSQQLIALAEATPAEKYSWRPASGVRSTSEVYMHIAIANFYLLSVTGPKVPADLNENMEKTVTSKAEVMAWLKRSLEAVKAAHAAISPKDLERKVKIAGREATVDGIYLRIIIHANEHMGQLIAYARMTGVVPPWSKE